MWPRATAAVTVWPPASEGAQGLRQRGSKGTSKYLRAVIFELPSPAFCEAKPACRAGFFLRDAVVLASPKLSSIVELEPRPIGTVCAGLSADLRNSG